MKFKKILAGVLATCIMLGSLSIQGIVPVTGSAVNAANGVMRENMTSQQFVHEMGLGINLGNTMEAYNASNCESASYKWPPTVGRNTPQDYEKCWGAVVTTQEVIDGMKNAGFNTIRIPVFWGNMMENDGTYTISDEYIGRVKEIVDYCRNAGVYTVINIHHFDEFIIRRNTKEKSAEIFSKIWTQIAEKFKDYSDYLIFEGYNEYLGGGQIDSNDKINDLPQSEGYDWTNTLNQAFVDAVRATGGNNANRMLIASGYWTNIDLTTKSQFKIPTDTAKDRLMVSVHYVDNSMYWSSQIGSDYWMNYSINQCKLLKRAFTDKGIPVFIGETTSVYPRSNFAQNATTTTSSEALDKMLRLITSYDFIPVLWDTNDNFYSRTEYKVKSSTDEQVIKTLAKELEEKTIPTTAASQVNTTTTEPTTNFTPVKKYIPEKPIVPKKVRVVTGLTVKSKAKKTINVKWNKVNKAKGYEVQVSKSKKFKKVLIKKKTSKKKLVIKSSKLKSKKKYYVRVRAYATYKDKDGIIRKINSKWNKVPRKVKIK